MSQAVIFIFVVRHLADKSLVNEKLWNTQRNFIGRFASDLLKFKTVPCRNLANLFEFRQVEIQIWRVRRNCLIDVRFSKRYA